MATDAKGNNHKAAGRPDGGQFDRKTGQGSDDDLDVGAVPVDFDEEDSIAVARYLDSLDPGVRFFMSDGAGALEARTLDDPDIADELCYERAVSDRLFRQRRPWASRDRLLENPYLTEAQRSALTTPTPEAGRVRVSDRNVLRAMLYQPDEQYRARAAAANIYMVRADPELRRLVQTDPSELVRGYLGSTFR